jgi:hypothetical protein
MADKINVSSLDFEDIKSSLKNYLKAQDQFKDYDFEGSSLSILLDVLASNTHYNAYYLNMVANEMFLDTAEMRSSVVSRAKALGYTPRSRTSASAIVKIQCLVPVDADQPATINVPQYAKYKTVIDGTTYYFNTTQGYFANATGETTEDGQYNIYETDNIRIYEGNYVQQKYIVDKQNLSQKFIITNKDVDTTTLIVAVQQSESNTNTVLYNKVVNITDVGQDSQVYFLQEVEKQLFDVYFGDGVVGKELAQGNVVSLQYLVSNGSLANKASTFAYTAPISGYAQNVITVDVASGGAERETIESIRYLAPLNYNAQNRTVTSTDYQTSILQNYPNVQAVSAWGGEDNDPPIYGKVYISLKPVAGFTITDSVKDQIKDSILKSRNVVSITPEIVDPNYLYIKPTVDFYYNRELGNKNADELSTIVRNAILNYSTTDLEKFNSFFRYSKFVRSVDGSNRAIENSTVRIRLAQKLEMTPNVLRAFNASFSNPLSYPHIGHTGSITSNTFEYQGTDTCYISDDGYGVLGVYRNFLGERRLIQTNLGTVDYDTGQVQLSQFAPSGVNDKVLELIIYPRNQDVFVVRNQILLVDDADILLTAFDSQTAYGKQIDTIYAGNQSVNTQTGASIVNTQTGGY